MAPSLVSSRIKRKRLSSNSSSLKKIKLSEREKLQTSNVLKSLDNINTKTGKTRVAPEIWKKDPQVYHQLNGIKKVNKPQRRKVPGNSIEKWKKGIPIFVVDEHNGSMVATLRSIELGHCPEKFKFLHFDSHPDLGCITEEDRELIDECYYGNPSIRKLYRSTDIATWIIPMVIMGHTDYVVWACAHWCNQFTPGRWTLLCGKDRTDGKMKVGTRGNKKWTCLEYWDSGDSVCKEEDFEYYREWTLEVIKFNKQGKLSEKKRKSVIAEFSVGPWVLDIDEDFFSCNNPYRDEFCDLFGDDMYKCLEEVYDWSYDQSESADVLKFIYKSKLYLVPWKKFSELEIVKELIENMQSDDELAESYMRKFHKFVRKIWPNGRYEDSDDENDENEDEERSRSEQYVEEKDKEERQETEVEEQDFKEELGDDENIDSAILDEIIVEEEEAEESEEENEEWDIPNFFALDALHRAGNLSCLPHHISTANEIKTLANEVEKLLIDLPFPVHVTLATSRLDRYLPDSQANVIHGLCEDLLSGVCDTENIRRLDRPKYSVDNVVIEDQDKMKALNILDICEPEEGAANVSDHSIGVL